MKSVAAVAAKPEKLVAGVMSGTSADGVDAVLVRVRGSGEAITWRLLRHETLQYAPKVREMIQRCSEPGGGDAAALCRLNVLLGELFARAVQHVVRQAGLDIGALDLVGSHGQTVHNLPAPVTIAGVSVRASLQIGDPAVIAERTGVTTVTNFRARDLAAGGVGGPLVAYIDYLLLRHRARGRVVISLGGIASLTAIPASAGPEGVLAFDTGPGSLITDALVARLTGGREAFDFDGRYARRGRVQEAILKRMLGHPYLEAPPPKTCGREEFGGAFLAPILQAHGAVAGDDLLATATRFTAESIALACRRFAMPRHVYEEAIVSGGGARNGFLLEQLREALPELSIKLSDEYGLPAAAKEAVAFALLASEAIQEAPANLPSATGAARRVILGTVAPGGRAA